MTEPRMSEAEWRLLLTIARRSAARQPGANREVDDALSTAQAERDAAYQPPTESEVMPSTNRSPRNMEPAIEGLHTKTPPPPQPEGACRRERLHNLIVAKTQHSLWTAYDLADAILAAELPRIPDEVTKSAFRYQGEQAHQLVTKLEAERDRLREAPEWYANKGNYHHVGRHQDHPISNDYGDRARAALREGGGYQKPDTTDITRDAELGRLVRRMVDKGRIIKLSDSDGPDGKPIFGASNVMGREYASGATLDEAVAVLVAKLGEGSHGWHSDTYPSGMAWRPISTMPIGEICYVRLTACCCCDPATARYGIKREDYGRIVAPTNCKGIELVFNEDHQPQAWAVYPYSSPVK